jgi:hypothetical protein
VEHKCEAGGDGADHERGTQQAGRKREFAFGGRNLFSRPAAVNGVLGDGESCDDVHFLIDSTGSPTVNTLENLNEALCWRHPADRLSKVSDAPIGLEFAVFHHRKRCVNILLG